MRQIRKKSEPAVLTRFRSRPDAAYDGPNFTPVKNVIRQQLLEEQGHLCAYCMQRIKLDNMKIEHCRCQNSYPDKQLDYKNMLGCCKGNEGMKFPEQTCDTRKRNSDLKYSPAMVEHRIESRIKFLANGMIISGEEEFDGQINMVLNLNHYRLKKNREVVLSEIQALLGKKPGRRTKMEIQKIIRNFNAPDEAGRLRPFAGAILYDLKKRLRRAP